MASILEAVQCPVSLIEVINRLHVPQRPYRSVSIELQG